MFIIVVQFQVFFSCSEVAQSLGQADYNVVFLSPTEAEFIAACESTKKAVWLRSLLSEILGVNNGSTPHLCRLGITAVTWVPRYYHGSLKKVPYRSNAVNELVKRYRYFCF
jgi:hypothetical protein